MKLTSCKKIAYGRCVPPEVTIRRLEKILGARYTYRFEEEKVDDTLYWSSVLVPELGFRGMGKGTTPELSKAGALAESAEWLTSVEPANNPGFTTGHQDDLDHPLPIEDLLTHLDNLTPERLRRLKCDPALQYWIEGTSLIDDRKLQAPVEFVHRISGPNGRAAGNTLEEAIVHAVLEIFERRAHITVLRQQRVLPTFDLESITDPVVCEQIEFLRARGIQITLKDLSFGGVLPCIGAYFRDPAIPPEFQFHHFFKVGASFDRREALLRVFTEFVQGRRRDEFIQPRPSEQARVLNHDFRRMLCVEPETGNYLSAFMFGFMPMRDAGFLLEGETIPFRPSPGYEDCLDDIRQAREICRQLGKDFVVVDLTDPDIGFPVAQVVIPGYSDVLPFHPPDSPALFRPLSRDDVLAGYPLGRIDPPDSRKTLPGSDTPS